MSRWVPLALVLLAPVAVAGCLEPRTGPGADGDPGPGPVPECDFDTHRVRVEVEGVDSALSRAGIHDPEGDVKAMACLVSEWSELQGQGPASAEGDVLRGRGVDQLWLFFEDGLLRLGTDVAVDGNGTLRVEADGPPVTGANLTWRGHPASVAWVEWFGDPAALLPHQAGTGTRPLENATGNLTLPVNSSRNEGVQVGLEVDVNRSRYPEESAEDAPTEGVRIDASVVAPNGSTVARGNLTLEDGVDHVVFHATAGAAGNWTVRYQVHSGEAQPGDLLYEVQARVEYGSRPG